jgi:hypothetical protein
MESTQEGLSRASKTKMEWIESLMGRNKFAQALEDIRELESREKIEERSTEWADLFYF